MIQYLIHFSTGFILFQYKLNFGVHFRDAWISWRWISRRRTFAGSGLRQLIMRIWHPPLSRKIALIKSSRTRSRSTSRSAALAKVSNLENLTRVILSPIRAKQSKKQKPRCRVARSPLVWGCKHSSPRRRARTWCSMSVSSWPNRRGSSGPRPWCRISSPWSRCSRVAARTRAPTRIGSRMIWGARHRGRVPTRISGRACLRWRRVVMPANSKSRTIGYKLPSWFSTKSWRRRTMPMLK